MKRRNYSTYKNGDAVEVNTASGWIPCKFINVTSGLVERTDVGPESEWFRFYIGGRGYRKPENGD